MLCARVKQISIYDTRGRVILTRKWCRQFTLFASGKYVRIKHPKEKIIRKMNPIRSYCNSPYSKTVKVTVHCTHLGNYVPWEISRLI